MYLLISRADILLPVTRSRELLPTREPLCYDLAHDERLFPIMAKVQKVSEPTFGRGHRVFPGRASPLYVHACFDAFESFVRLHLRPCESLLARFFGDCHSSPSQLALSTLRSKVRSRPGHQPVRELRTAEIFGWTADNS
jgi:hypothetical protein